LKGVVRGLASQLKLDNEQVMPDEEPWSKRFISSWCFPPLCDSFAFGHFSRWTSTLNKWMSEMQSLWDVKLNTNGGGRFGRDEVSGAGNVGLGSTFLQSLTSLAVMLSC
jgi:hypothetical protein